MNIVRCRRADRKPSFAVQTAMQFGSLAQYSKESMRRESTVSTTIFSFGSPTHGWRGNNNVKNFAGMSVRDNPKSQIASNRLFSSAEGYRNKAPRPDT